MKVRFTKNTMHRGRVYNAGDEHDVEKALAETCIDQEQAEAVEQKEKPKPTPPKPKPNENKNKPQLPEEPCPTPTPEQLAEAGGAENAPAAPTTN